jgi:hypothetical protein
MLLMLLAFLPLPAAGMLAGLPPLAGPGAPRLLPLSIAAAMQTTPCIMNVASVLRSCRSCFKCCSNLLLLLLLMMMRVVGHDLHPGFACAVLGLLLLGR